MKSKEEFLKEKGWHTWYNPDYWVHPKTIKDKTRQDYTEYGLNLEDAYNFEVNNGKPWSGQFMHGSTRW